MAGLSLTDRQVFPISNFYLHFGGEFMTTLHESGSFNFPPELHGLGMQIHFISMILFASIIFVYFTIGTDQDTKL